MLFGHLRGRRVKNISLFTLFLVLAMVLTLSVSCTVQGSIMILENPNGTGFEIDLKNWSEKDQCKLFLNRGDVLQIEVVRERGEIALVVSGNKGSEPYAGNRVESGVFTVTVSETDEYMIGIIGQNATGKLKVKIFEQY